MTHGVRDRGAVHRREGPDVRRGVPRGLHPRGGGKLYIHPQECVDCGACEAVGSISEPLVAALSRDGFEPVVAATAEGGLEAFRARQPDLVLLDVMLPDGDGRDVLRRIRSTSRTPVVMLTARGEELDTV